MRLTPDGITIQTPKPPAPKPARAKTRKRTTKKQDQAPAGEAGTESEDR